MKLYSSLVVPVFCLMKNTYFLFTSREKQLYFQLLHFSEKFFNCFFILRCKRILSTHKAALYGKTVQQQYTNFYHSYILSSCNSKCFDCKGWYQQMPSLSVNETETNPMCLGWVAVFIFDKSCSTASQYATKTQEQSAEWLIITKLPVGLTACTAWPWQE